jgi:hypothetical protein
MTARPLSAALRGIRKALAESHGSDRWVLKDRDGGPIIQGAHLRLVMNALDPQALARAEKERDEALARLAAADAWLTKVRRLGAPAPAKPAPADDMIDDITAALAEFRVAS